MTSSNVFNTVAERIIKADNTAENVLLQIPDSVSLDAVNIVPESSLTANGSTAITNVSCNAVQSKANNITHTISNVDDSSLNRLSIQLDDDTDFIMNGSRLKATIPFFALNNMLGWVVKTSLSAQTEMSATIDNCTVSSQTITLTFTETLTNYTSSYGYVVVVNGIDSSGSSHTSVFPNALQGTLGYTPVYYTVYVLGAEYDHK